MRPLQRRHLYLPERDRSFWKQEAPLDSPLLYLAWGARDFTRHPVPACRHEGWVFVLIEEGVPTMEVRGRPVRMPAGTVAVIGPDCPFGWRGASGTTRFLLWMWRGFAGTGVPDGLHRAHAARMLSRRDRKALLLLHDLCRREILRSPAPEREYLEGCRILFETTVRRLLWDQQGEGRSSGAASLARAWIDGHTDSREPVARLCDYLNVSQSTLYRLFTAEFGMSPLAYFHQVRMQRAHDLLTDTARSVKEVAALLGYEHFSDLSRAYRKHFGHSPTVSRHA